MFFNISELASHTLVYDAKHAIKRIFKIDVEQFSWVKDYIKDKEIREKIVALRKEIEEIRRLPINKDELRKMFIKRIEAINDFRVIQLVEHLKNVQDHKDVLINEMLMDNRKFSGASLQIGKAGLPPETIDQIFSQLPEGVTEKEKSKRINQCQSEIKSLETQLKTELNIGNRWLYKPDGTPHPYPMGCRWTSYVQTWELVAARFERPVDIEGYEMENPFEKEAYVQLGLGKIFKRPPLQKSRENN